MSNPELSEINPLAYPIEYFDAQVHFAQRWAEISGQDFTEILRTKTAIHRRMTENAITQGQTSDDWANLISGATSDSDPEAITELLYGAYRGNPCNAYVRPTSPSALGFDYIPDTQTVKIHFTNPERGVKPLSDENMVKRRRDFRAVLEEVRTEHPEAALLMSATWLRSTSRYRSLSPPDISEQKSLMSTEMNFGGNSVWGQFIDATGNGNRHIYDQFIQSVAKAVSLDMLVESFPYKTLLAVDPIGTYYEYYGPWDMHPTVGSE